MQRRNFLLGLGLGTAGLLIARPSAQGSGGHGAYFQQLTHALKAENLARPTMIVDLDRIDHNIAELRKHVGADKAYRIVAKSIPVPGLIDYAMRQAESQRLMVFHQSFLNELAMRAPATDVLMGKPMPVAAAHRFYQHFQKGAFDPARQLQWLVNSEQRLAQYASLADGLGVDMLINIEIDVGMHRGGLSSPEQLHRMLNSIAAHPRLNFSGLMGYDPHVAKAPTIMGIQDREFAAVQRKYQAFKHVLDSHPSQANSHNLTLNTAGSPTFRRWRDVKGLANEVSAGSALVKATDFDIPALDSYKAAVFIATPVLKASEGMQMPIVPAVGQLQSIWDPNRARTFFVYGGFWKATPVSPAGLMTNPLYGHSTNQEMLNGSVKVDLKVDDFVFYRPTQSEFVMLQFGDILAMRKGVIEDVWPVLPQTA
jgi:D-serine deaminase-like pyridoxal phosphate-dependent protein